MQEDCIPKSVVAVVVTNALQRAKASPDVIVQVLQGLDEVKTFFGYVSAFVTDVQSQSLRAYVFGDQPGVGNISFEFPPNVAAYADELKRGQNEDRLVKIFYQVDANGKNVIHQLTIFAGPDDPGSSKRKS